MYENLFNSDYLCINDNDSSLSVIIGWYPINPVIQKLSDLGLLGNCATIGNLFNPLVGVDLLIRNLLHNNQISTLILVKATHQDHQVDSVGSLQQALSNYDHFQRVCVSQPELTFEDYAQVSCIRVFTCDSISNLVNVLKTISPIPSTRTRVTKPKIIPLKKTNYPGRHNSQYVEDTSIESAHINASNRVLINGLISQGKKSILELLNLNICVTNAPDNINQLMSICTDDEILYIDNFIHPIKESINYNYGHRLRYNSEIDLVAEAIKKLTKRPDSLAVYLPIFQDADLIEGNSPCMVSIWLRVIAERLELFATFRSNDIWKAWKYNAYGLRGLQIYIANHIKVMPGKLHTNSFSAHIYVEDIAQVPLFKNPRPTYLSAVGNFYIELVQDRITIKHTDNNGDDIKTYIGYNPLFLVRDICFDNPSIEPEHIGYLGVELQKAKNCLTTLQPYVQDLT